MRNPRRVTGTRRYYNSAGDLVRQEIHCHACGMWVQFVIDQSIDGNHKLDCPNCGHAHYRVVRNGDITSIRWDPNSVTTQVQGATYSTMQRYQGALTGFAGAAWWASFGSGQ